MKRKILTLSMGAVLLFFLPGCLSPRAETPAGKRAAIEAMRQETLAELYRQRPTARQNVERADGYAVFSNVSGQYLFVGAGGGYGVAVDYASGRNTYMKMLQGGLGLGVGVQDIRVVFVFHSRKALSSFINSGWEFGAQADAAAKAEDKGGSATGEVSISSEIDMYTMTEAGLMAKVNLAGSKYWKDKQLNY